MMTCFVPFPSPELPPLLSLPSSSPERETFFGGSRLMDGFGFSASTAWAMLPVMGSIAALLSVVFSSTLFAAPRRFSIAWAGALEAFSSPPA